MIKDGYARLVEYNIRFGDPECQVLMLRMKNDLIKLILNCLEGSLSKTKLEWEDDNSATVVVRQKVIQVTIKKIPKLLAMKILRVMIYFKYSTQEQNMMEITF